MKLFSEILIKKININMPTEALDYAKKIDQQINRITGLVNDLLDISKIRSGKFEMHFEFFPVSALIKELVGGIQLINPNKQIVLKNDLEGVRIMADKTRISQVVINLLNNAIKYSDGKDKIEVAAMNKRGVVVIAVKDWGVGIDKKYQKKIFERYFSLNGSTGLGIGLYICSQIIKKHRGKIWVKSSPGKGTCFYFSLPLKEN
jgi:signal transduction histidine kinase